MNVVVIVVEYKSNQAKINPFIHALSSIKFTYAGFVCLKIIVQGMKLKEGVVELP